jgi:hypothetical protein
MSRIEFLAARMDSVDRNVAAALRMCAAVFVGHVFDLIVSFVIDAAEIMTVLNRHRQSVPEN